jgi:hypothetical protein
VVKVVGKGALLGGKTLQNKNELDKFFFEFLYTKKGRTLQTEKTGRYARK